MRKNDQKAKTIKLLNTKAANGKKKNVKDIYRELRNPIQKPKRSLKEDKRQRKMS
jgi:hypothetical protein